MPPETGLNTRAMCWARGKGILAISAEACARLLPLDGNLQSPLLNHAAPEPSCFRPSGFCPCPFSVLCAWLNQLPPLFFDPYSLRSSGFHSVGLVIRLVTPFGAFGARPIFIPLVNGINAGTSPQQVETPVVPASSTNPRLRPVDVLYHHRNMMAGRFAGFPLDAEAGVK